LGVANFHSPCTHRLSNILQRLQTHIVEDKINLAADLALGVVRNADASGFRNTLQARGDVDAVAENVAVVEDDISDVNTDAKFNSDVLRNVSVLSGHSALDFGGAPRRVYGAGEFDQHAVAGGLDDAASMLGDRRIEKRLPQCLELRERAFLVTTHQTAVAGNIRRQHSRQPSFHPPASQRMFPNR